MTRADFSDGHGIRPSTRRDEVQSHLSPAAPSALGLTTVGEACAVVGGGTPPTSNPAYWSGSIPWITSADIADRGDVSPRRAVTEEAVRHSATNVIPAGSIVVVTRVGLGKVGIAPTNLAFSQDSHGLVFDQEQIEPRYLAHQLKRAVQIFKSTSRGTTISGVTKRQLSELPVTLPPIREQRRVADWLDELFSQLDAGVAALERVKANLKRYRAAVLKAAVEGKLTERWREVHPGVEPASELLKRILAERRTKWEEQQLTKFEKAGKKPPPGWQSKYKEPQPPDTSGLPELPATWCWVSGEQIAQSIANGLSQRPDGGPDGCAVLRISAVRPMSVDLSDVRHYKSLPNGAERYFVQPGDILFTRYNGSPDLCGAAGLVRDTSTPTLHPDKLIRVRTVCDSILPAFIELAAAAGETRAALARAARTTAGQTGISGADVRLMPLPVPPSVEQRRAADAVQELLAEAGRAQEDVGRQSRRSASLRWSALSETFGTPL